jgi:carbamoyl-phosphate synthase large subunit
MRSTGEVMGFAATFGHAFAKSQMGAGTALPDLSTINTNGAEVGVLITVNDFDKGGGLKIARDLHRLGVRLYATQGTGELIARTGLPVQILAKATDTATGYTTLDALRDGKIQLIINTPLGPGSREDGAKIRRLATRMEIPLITTLSAAQAAVNGMKAVLQHDLGTRSLQAHYAGNGER